MGMRMPETRWAVFKRQVINLRSCCILLVDSVESMTMHGLANPQFRICFFVCRLFVCQQASQPASQIYDHFHILTQTLQYKAWRCIMNSDSTLICYMFLSDAAMYLVCKIWGFRISVADNSGFLWCDTVSYWTTWQRRQCYIPEDLNPVLNMDECNSNLQQISLDTHNVMQWHNDFACLWQCCNCYFGLHYAGRDVYVLQAGFVSLEIEGYWL